MNNSTKRQPLVSICIPTFNGEEFIKESMDSAIKQTYEPLEIIISDDASQDNTLEIVKSYTTKTTIPVHIVNHKPNGIGANWNNCVKHAKGKYIKFLFQDDVLLTNCITKMMQLMLSNKSVGLVYCKRDFLYEIETKNVKEFKNKYGNLQGYWHTLKVEQGVLPGSAYLKDKGLVYLPKNKVGEPTAVLLKKECFEKVGYFNESLKQTLDHEYWFRVMTKFDIGFIDEVLIKFRLHENQASNINKEQQVSDNYVLHKEYYKHLFWKLHPNNRLKLLKLYHPLFKSLTKLKSKI